MLTRPPGRTPPPPPPSRPLPLSLTPPPSCLPPPRPQRPRPSSRRKRPRSCRKCSTSRCCHTRSKSRRERRALWGPRARARAGRPRHQSRQRATMCWSDPRCSRNCKQVNTAPPAASSSFTKLPLPPHLCTSARVASSASATARLHAATSANRPLTPALTLTTGLCFYSPPDGYYAVAFQDHSWLAYQAVWPSKPCPPEQRIAMSGVSQSLTTQSY